MKKACVKCGCISEQSRCPEHRIKRARGRRFRQLRQQIIEADGYACAACGVQLTGHGDVEVDHIVALADGGSEHPSNLQTLCKPCHKDKGMG